MTTSRRTATVLRKLIFARDRGICAVCGTDTVSWAEGLLAHVDSIDNPIDRANTMAAICYDLNIPLERLRFGPDGKGGLWDVDHIRPTAMGGRDIAANLQTLCILCHRTKTAGERDAIRRYHLKQRRKLRKKYRKMTRR